MNKWGSFCSYCRDAISGEFPRLCGNGHATYLTWQGVAVAMQLVSQNGKTYLLVIRRGIEPFSGHYALPGGFAENEETLAMAAIRELAEETGIHHDPDRTTTFWQAVGTPHRSGNDPRRPMLQFEIMPDLSADNIDFSFKTAETQGLALIHYDVTGLVDTDDNPVTLCFPLHQQAALRFFQR